MTKKIEILIVVVILFLLAALFGCKDKAQEPNKWVITEAELLLWIDGEDEWPPKVINIMDGGKKIKYIPEPNELKGD
ncbi:unnamed protein product [marine sediment metagenome]|uniref:Uncharacterized protein n=1 Tax=marine sediment metagenome TaxID=412755 RepID=X0SVR1_9ZZZZ